jgi:hypothetical protein
VIKLRSNLTIPLFINIPNTGPPKFKQELKDIEIRVGEVLKIKLPSLVDPDPEDRSKVEVVDFDGGDEIV